MQGFEFDLLTLSRIQFAFTISFHYIYPPLSIGLGVIMVMMEGLWLKTGRPIYHQMARFWTKVFALTFAMGVATGIVMEFEFGTNWATYSRFVGDVFGSALAAEGIFARKLAAFEGHYETRTWSPLYLFGWVNDHEERVQFGIAVPGLLSLLAHGDPRAEVIGLHEFKKADRPPVNFVFQTYHAMIAIGVGLAAVSIFSMWMWWRGKLFETRRLLWILVFSVLGPQLANQFGWWSAEVGRQPWIVYGLLRTTDGLSKVVEREAVLTSLILFSFVYALLFAAFIYLLNDKIHHGPDPDDLHPRGRLADALDAHHLADS